MEPKLSFETARNPADFEFADIKKFWEAIYSYTDLMGNTRERLAECPRLSERISALSNSVQGKPPIQLVFEFGLVSGLAVISEIDSMPIDDDLAEFFIDPSKVEDVDRAALTFEFDVRAYRSKYEDKEVPEMLFDEFLSRSESFDEWAQYKWMFECGFNNALLAMICAYREQHGVAY
jgi:hypothetical protein